MNSAFPQSLRDLAKAKADAAAKYNVLALQDMPTDPDQIIEQALETRMAYRAVVVATEAFESALNAYTEKERVA